jgi:hypothetical protein
MLHNAATAACKHVQSEREMIILFCIFIAGLDKLFPTGHGDLNPESPISVWSLDPLTHSRPIGRLHPRPQRIVLQWARAVPESMCRCEILKSCP